MLILFTTACCGVSETTGIWAAADGETKEVSEELAAEMLRVGYAVPVVGEAAKVEKPKPKAKQV